MNKIIPLAVLISLVISSVIVYKPEENNCIDEIDCILDLCEISNVQTRSETVNHYENGTMGGSWFDDFEDDSGIEWKSNLTIENQSVMIKDFEITPGANVVGFWPFNGDIGDLALDISGNENHGTLIDMDNGASVEGIKGEGVLFNGSSGYIDCGNSASFNSKNEITIEAWVKPQINNNSNRIVKHSQLISDIDGNFSGLLEDGDQFGSGVTSLGDLDGDGIEDIVVGASQSQSVWILFLTQSGTVKSYYQYNEGNGAFGNCVANIGDLDGDGNNDIVVGDYYDSEVQSSSGAVWILFLNSDGTIKSHQKITQGVGGFSGVLEGNHHFGESVSSLGDLDGDGVLDIAVGAQCAGNGYKGAVWILFLNTDGTVKSYQKISDNEGGFSGGLDASDYFGTSVTNISDLDKDGIQDIAVGASYDGDGHSYAGAIWILFMNGDGTVKDQQKISATEGEFTGELEYYDMFGKSLTSIGDFNSDGTEDIAVGSWWDDDGETDRGAVWLLYLNRNGTVNSYTKISDTNENFTGNLSGDAFGRSVSLLNDIDGDGFKDLVVGARDDGSQNHKGAVWIISLHDNLGSIVNKHTSYGLYANTEKIKFQVNNNFTIGKNQNNWNHIAVTYDRSDKRLYKNGNLLSTIPFSEEIKSNNNRILLGSGFHGIIDEIIIYNKTLSSQDIYNHSRLYHNNGTLISSSVILPENHSWVNFHFNRSVTNGTYLNISVHDAKTNEILASNITIDSIEESIDLSQINALNHSKIYFRADFVSNGSATPILFDWAINWTPMVQPQLISPIEDIHVLEEQPKINILNISSYFYDQYCNIASGSFGIEFISDTINISLALNGSALSITRLSENFTGKVSVVLSCTNMYDLARLTNEFDIVVINIDDPPVWVDTPLGFIIDEGDTEISDYYLKDYIFDAEGDTLEFDIINHEQNISAEVLNDTRIRITAQGDYFGSTYIEVVAYETDNVTVSADTITIPIVVEAVNDPPATWLISPNNGSIIAPSDIRISWMVSDVDNPFNDLTYKLYLGKTPNPDLYSSQILETYYTITELEDNTTYYWYVLAYDGMDTGICLNKTWSFTTASEADVPKTNLTWPSNGTILNSTEITLKWTSTNPTEFPLIYHLFFGSDLNNITEIKTTYNEHTLSGLQNNLTYYWYVIPTAGILWGLCSNDHWQFSIDINYTPPELVYDLEISIDRNSINIIRGNSTTFNITFLNTGHTNFSVNIELSGSVSDYIDLQDSQFIDFGNTTMLATISIPRDIEPATYDLIINITYPGGSIEKTLNVIVIKEKDAIIDTDDIIKEDKTPLWIWIVIVLLIILIIIGIFLVIFRKRFDKKPEDEINKKENDEPDLEEVETEVEPVPVMGNNQETISIIEEKIKVEEPRRFKPEVTHERIIGKVPKELSEEPEPPVDYLSEHPSELINIPELMPPEPKKKELPAVPEPPTEPIIHASITMNIVDKSAKCRICFGNVKKGLYLAKCDCGKAYHPECLERVGECPNCKGKVSKEQLKPDAVTPKLPLPPEEEPIPEIPESPEFTSLPEPQSQREDSLPLPLPTVLTSKPTILSETKSNEPPKKAEMIVLENSVNCRICFGTIKPGLQVIKCRCGKIYHVSCGIRVGECPSCEADYSEFIEDADEEVLIENVKDSLEGKKKKIGKKVEATTSDDLLMQLKKQLVNREITIDEYREMKKEIIE